MPNITRVVVTVTICLVPKQGTHLSKVRARAGQGSDHVLLIEEVGSVTELFLDRDFFDTF